MNIDYQTLEQLVLQRAEHKRQEEAAAELRREADKRIAEIVAPLRGEKSTVTLGLASLGLKLNVGYPSNTRVDSEAVRKDVATLPKEVLDCFRWKAEVIAAEQKKLADAQRLVLSKYVTTTPGTPSV